MKDEHGNPTTPIFKECSGMKLSAVMNTYHTNSLDHDLTKFTPRIIDNVIDTEEAQ
jgi:hypothetical protein